MSPVDRLVRHTSRTIAPPLGESAATFIKNSKSDAGTCTGCLGADRPGEINISLVQCYYGRMEVTTLIASLFARCAMLPLLVLPLACGDDNSSSDPRLDANGNMPAADARIGPDAMPNLGMSFFVTSTGSGANGGDLGGLGGADSKCQALATNGGGGGRTWHAYLSTGSSGPAPAVDARDRIGSGPWFNQQGTMVAANVGALHSDGILGALMFDENGGAIPGNEHDVLTGSATDGRLSDASQTCDNWTNSTINSQAQVGHADTEQGDGESWNSQHSGSCDEASLNGNAGAGRLYCFAID